MSLKVRVPLAPRKESYDLKTRNGTEIERDKYSSLIFPDAVDYENLNLRDYVQEIFNGVDVDNDGRLRIEMLSKAIQYNTSLVSMLLPLLLLLPPLLPPLPPLLPLLLLPPAPLFVYDQLDVVVSPGG